MTEELRNAISLLNKHSIFLVYCANICLGTQGPFVQLYTEEEIDEVLKMEPEEEVTEEDLLSSGIDEIMIAGE